MCEQCKGYGPVRTEWLRPGNGATVRELTDLFGATGVEARSGPINWDEKTDLTIIDRDEDPSSPFSPHAAGIDRPRIIEALRRVGLKVYD